MYSPKVTVIVPVYNAQEYIDKCLKSITEQTFKEIEIIVVNDGSADETDRMCREWSDKDKRICYIAKENEGQGVARNLAIEKSRSEYLVFVDVDDWIDENYIEELYNKITLENADVVLSDYVSADLINETETVMSQNIDKHRNENVLTFVMPTLWAKIWRKELFLRYDIQQPRHYFEDISVVPFLLSSASKIEYAKDVRYWYLIRYGSTTKSVNSLDDRAKSLEYLVQLFEENNLMEKYYTCVKEFVLMRCQADLSSLRMVAKELYETSYKQHESVTQKKFNVLLDDTVCRNMSIWGSYNLFRITKEIIGLRIQSRFMNSSVISATSSIPKRINQMALKHENMFRQWNVVYDCTKRFMSMNPVEFVNCEYMFIDFLDERFPIGCEQDCYFTISDAYKEIENSYIPKELMYIGECTELWKDSCKLFAKHIEECFGDKKIILLRMKLAEFYGVSGKETRYENYEYIQKVNAVLDGYYDYFEELVPMAVSIELEHEEYFYTDVHFKYGCYPWHLNNDAYYSITQKLQNVIENE